MHAPCCSAGQSQASVIIRITNMPPKAETSDSSSEDEDLSRFASVAVSSAQLEQQAEASKQVRAPSFRRACSQVLALSGGAALPLASATTRCSLLLR